MNSLTEKRDRKHRENLTRAKTHYKIAYDAMEEEIDRLESELKKVRREKGAMVNKTKAAAYLQMSRQQFHRLASNYEGQGFLQFNDDGYISIGELDRFEEFYKPKRRKR